MGQLKLQITADIKEVMIILLLSFPFFEVSWIKDIFVIGALIKVLGVMSFFYIVLMFFINKRVPCFAAVIIFIIQIYMLLVTWIHGLPIYGCIYSIYSMMGIVLIYDFYLSYKPDLFVRSQLLCYEILIYMNLISETIFPDGMGEKYTWILGYYNRHSQYFIPAVLFTLIYAKMNKKILRSVVLIFAIALSAILAGSGGVIVALTCMALFYLFLKNFTFIFNFFFPWIMQVIFLLLTLAGTQIPAFTYVINSLLSKQNSFSGRVRLWMVTIQQINERLYLGHGIEPNLERVANSHMGVDWATYAHNLILEVLYLGGLGYVALLVLLIIVSGKELEKVRSSIYAKIVIVAFFGWGIQSMVEAYTNSLLMVMFIIAFYTSVFLEHEMSKDIVFDYETA